MPQLIAGALTYAGLTGGIALAAAAGPVLISYASIIGYGATLVASIGYSSYARRRAQRSANANLQDRMVPVRASDAARTIVYGETRVAGVLVYAATHGAKRENLSLVYALGGHTFSSIESVWLNDAAVTLDGSEYVTSAPWAQTAELPWAEDWIAGGNGSTYVLTTPDTLIAVDSVAIWSEGDTGGEGYTVGRVSTAITSGFTVNLSTKTITLTTADYAGLSLTATCRVSRATSYVRAKRFLGSTAGQADGDLQTATASDTAPWTADHLGKGVPRLHIALTWNESAFANGLPSPTAVVRGKKVYDPRADSTNGGSGAQRVADPTTWAWSNNPALCAADYLMSDLGFGIASSRIDWPSVITAANVCDELVPTDASTGTQKRYTCDGVLSTDATRKANLESILACMIGSADFSGGLWYIRAAAYVSPSIDLDETDLASGDISVRARAPRSDLFNAVRGTFRDPSNLYQVTDFPPYASSTYAAEDNGEVVYEDVELALVADSKRAQRIAKLILYRHRQALTVDATFRLPALILQRGDTCRLTIARYGWSNKIFRVVDWQLVDAAAVRMTLQEEAAAVYSWTFNEATTPDPAPNTNLPTPGFVPAPANVVVAYSASSYIVRTDGTALPYVDLTWTAPPPDVQPIIYWKRAAETEYIELRLAVGATTGRIEGVSGGESLNIYIVNEAATGARSAIYWIARFTVHPDLPGNGAPIAALSANLLRNASLAASTGFWDPFVSDSTFTATVTRETSYPLLGSPSNGRLQIMSTATGGGKFAIAVSAFVPVEPGKRYVGYADLIGWAVDGFIALQWLLDAVPSGIAGPNVDGNIVPAVATESSTARPDRLEHYKRSVAFGVAPASARYARLLIVGGGTWLASDIYGAKYLFFSRPFFGEVPEGLTEAPPWDAGGANVVDAGYIAPGSVSDTRAYIYPATVAMVNKGTLAPSTEVFFAADLPAGDLDVEVTAIAQVRPGSTRVAWAGTVAYITAAGVSTTVQSGHSPASFGVAAGETQVDGPVTIKHRVVGFPGGSVRVRVLGVQYSITDLASGTLANITTVATVRKR